MTPHQSGFRTGFSCETCLLNVTNEWYQAINAGKIVGCVAIDFSNAFDVLSYDIIINK